MANIPIFVIIYFALGGVIIISLIIIIICFMIKDIISGRKKKVYCKKCGQLVDYEILRVRGKQLSIVVCGCSTLVKLGSKVISNETPTK